MPRYHLPNGKSVYSDKPIPDNELDAFLSEMTDAQIEQEDKESEERTSPSIFERSYNALSTPLTDAPSRWARETKWIQDLDKPTAEGRVHPLAAFGRGAIEGTADLVSGLSSPGNILMTLGTMGSGTLAKMGLTNIARLAGVTAKAAAAPGVIHGGGEVLGGAGQLATDPFGGVARMGRGAVETAGNILGGGYFSGAPKAGGKPTPTPKMTEAEAAKGYTLEEPKLPPAPPAITVAPPKPPSKANTIPPATPPKVTTTPPTAKPTPTIRPLAQIEAELFPLMEKSKTGTITIQELKRGQTLNKEWRNHPDFGKDPNTQGGAGDAEMAGSQPYKQTPVPTPAPPPIPPAPPQFSQQVMGEPPPGMFPPSSAYGGEIPPVPQLPPEIPPAPPAFAEQVAGPEPITLPQPTETGVAPPGREGHFKLPSPLYNTDAAYASGQKMIGAEPLPESGWAPGSPERRAIVGKSPTGVERRAPVIPEAPPQFAEQVMPEAPPVLPEPVPEVPPSSIPEAPPTFAEQVTGEPPPIQPPTWYPTFKSRPRKPPSPPPIPEGVDPTTGEILNEPVSQELSPFELRQGREQFMKNSGVVPADYTGPGEVIGTLSDGRKVIDTTSVTGREFNLPPERNVTTEVVPPEYSGPGEVVGTLSDGQKVIELPKTAEVSTEVPPPVAEPTPAPTKKPKGWKSKILTENEDFLNNIRNKIERGEEIGNDDILAAKTQKAKSDEAGIKNQLLDEIANEPLTETSTPTLPEQPPPIATKGGTRLVKGNRLANEKGEIDFSAGFAKLRESVNRFIADESGEGDIGPLPEEPPVPESVITGANRDTMVNAPVGHRILISKQSFRSTPELGVEAAKLGYEFKGTQKGKLVFEKIRESEGKAPLLEQDVPQVRKKGEKVNEEIGPVRKVWDLTRGLMSIDPPFVTSAAFRQAMPHAFTGRWFKAWGDAARSFGSQKFHDAYMAEINNSPLFRQRPPAPGSRSKKPSPSFAQEIGVRMTDSQNPINARQEGIKAQLAEKIPVYGRYVKASNRAFEAFLNGLRRRQLEAFVKDGKVKAKAFGDSSHDITQNINLAKEFAEFLNDSTGAGTLKTGIGKHQYSLEQHASKMADLFFSPRLMARNIRMLNPSTYIMANPAVRKQYLHAMMRTVGAWWGVAQLAQMMGAEVVTDPNNPDFGKIKIGNTRLDPGAGFQQFLVLGSRTKPAWFTAGEPTQTGIVPLDLATGLAGTPGGQYSSSISGESYPFGEGFNPPTRTSNAMNFLSNKFHPAAKLIWDIGSANERNPVYLGDRLMQMFLPMMTGDLAELAQTDPELIPLVIPWSASGGGSQTYTGEVTGPTITPTLGRITGIPQLPELDYVFGNPGGMEPE